MFDPETLAPGEQIATVADIRDCVDLPRMVIRPHITLADGSVHHFWTKPDGTPLPIEVRALSFAERRTIDHLSKEDDHHLALETCLLGISQPRFEASQREILEARHPAVIDEIAATIWHLSTLPATLITATVTALLAVEASSNADDTESSGADVA